MSTITADPTMLLVLSQMKEVTEIKDADGNLVGVYTPKTLTADDIRKMFDIEKACEKYEKEKHLAKPFSEIVAKLRKMERAKPKKTLKEIGMKFTVATLPSVDDALTRLWLDAEDGQAVAEASNWIERQLKNNPLTKVTRIDDVYFLRRDPLVALCKKSALTTDL